MAGETINKESAAWHTLQASASVADNDLHGGTLTAISGTALSADEQKYPMLDLRLTITVSAGTVINDTVDVYRLASDGTSAASPVDTTGGYYQEYVGSFVMDDAAATATYYLYGVANIDANAKYQVVNKSGALITCVLAGRTRGWTTV